jgi:hypothetical protein
MYFTQRDRAGRVAAEAWSSKRTRKRLELIVGPAADPPAPGELPRGTQACQRCGWPFATSRSSRCATATARAVKRRARCGRLRWDSSIARACWWRGASCAGSCATSAPTASPPWTPPGSATRGGARCCCVNGARRKASPRPEIFGLCVPPGPCRLLPETNRVPAHHACHSQVAASPHAAGRTGTVQLHARLPATRQDLHPKAARRASRQA